MTPRGDPAAVGNVGVVAATNLRGHSDHRIGRELARRQDPYLLAIVGKAGYQCALLLSGNQRRLFAARDDASRRALRYGEGSRAQQLLIQAAIFLNALGEALSPTERVTCRILGLDLWVKAVVAGLDCAWLFRRLRAIPVIEDAPRLAARRMAGSLPPPATLRILLTVAPIRAPS